MRASRASLRALAVSVAFSTVAFFSSSAAAIVVADNPAGHVVSGVSPYNMVGYYGGASAVLIDSTHALTAAHVASNAGLGTMYLDLAGGRQGFSVSQVSICPTADLAVITLSQSTGLSGFPLYTGTGEIGKTGILLGYGVSGTGSSDPSTYPRGTLRIGYNVIGNASGKYLYMTFDAPNNKASLGAGMEALAAAGDSGGATLITVDGGLYLAGIHSSITSFSGGGESSLLRGYGNRRAGEFLRQLDY